MTTSPLPDLRLYRPRSSVSTPTRRRRSLLLPLQAKLPSIAPISNEEERIRADDYVYAHVPLLQALLAYANVRRLALAAEGYRQMTARPSSDGWWATLLVWQGRALDGILWPWLTVTLHAVAVTIVGELYFDFGRSSSALLENWQIVFGFVLNSTIAFLLVFRLNRAADRFWTSRTLWGNLIAKARTLVGCLTVHGENTTASMHGIRWTLAFAMATMERLRGRQDLVGDMFAGILTAEELSLLEAASHPPLYCIHRIRSALRALCTVDADTPPALAHWRVRDLQSLEQQLNDMMDACGGLERVRATPLPMVYVSHLRTLVLLTLLLFPYVYGPAWGWSTPVLVALAAFAWLGIEGAAVEAEAPFRQDRVNALNMDGYCENLMATTMQELQLRAKDWGETEPMDEEAANGEDGVTTSHDKVR